MIRPVLRRLHRWIGLVLALPLILQSMTGLIMAADPFVASLEDIPSANGPLTEPDDLRNPDVVAILTAARAAVPTGLVPVRWRVQPDAVVAVDFAVPGHQQAEAQVAVDTLFMKILWVRRHPDGFYRWVHSVHETLLMGSVGRAIVGAIGVALLLMALSGIPIWWPARKPLRAGFTVTRGAGGWRLQRELHGAVGIWIVALLLVQSVSGITMAFPQTARAIAGIPLQNQRGSRAAGEVDPIRSIAASVAAAQAALPGAILRDLRLPPVPGRPVTAILLPAGRWAGSPAAVLSMDPTMARVLSVQDPTTAPVGAFILDWLRAVHEGGAAGPAGRLLMCLFAVVLLLLPVTGITMWAMRQRRAPGAAATARR